MSRESRIWAAVGTAIALIGVVIAYFQLEVAKQPPEIANDAGHPKIVEPDSQKQSTVTPPLEVVANGNQATAIGTVNGNVSIGGEGE